MPSRHFNTLDLIIIIICLVLAIIAGLVGCSSPTSGYHPDDCVTTDYTHFAYEEGHRHGSQAMNVCEYTPETPVNGTPIEQACFLFGYDAAYTEVCDG
jgi:hypothetical protein